MAGFSVKVKTKQGQHIVKTLNEDTTINNLKQQISELTKIPETLLLILVGFPPKAMNLNNESCTLKDSGVTNGDTLIVEEKQLTAEEKEKILQNDIRIAHEIASQLTICIHTIIDRAITKKIVKLKS